MSAFPIAALAAGALLLGTAPARAQTDPRLANAVRAAQEGQSDSARAEVQRLLAATPPTDTLYPQILYTQAMVAGSAADMRRALQRVAVEYATSSWADDALLRLVQMDYATRNLEGAERNLERLRLDFPATPLLAQAAYWAGRAYFDDNKPASACRWVADGMAQAGSDVELQNQLGYLYQRCNMTADTGAAVAGADSGQAAKPDTTPGAPAPSPDSATRPPAPTPSAPAAPAKPAPRSAYRVQIAAVATQAAAESIAARARGAGFTTVTVQEKGLYKVRAGEFASRAEAQTAVGRLKARLGGSPFVVAEP
ncbi:MAG TPA: SPOR domain-containing protein [Gemmatimonadales bacterium]|nr:SPOR domain-containing protein [Gemmatimonadales bacterium]